MNKIQTKLSFPMKQQLMSTLGMSHESNIKTPYIRYILCIYWYIYVLMYSIYSINRFIALRVSSDYDIWENLNISYSDLPSFKLGKKKKKNSYGHNFVQATLRPGGQF